MVCEQMGTHTVKLGDSLYKIANMHKMTMEELMEMNPGVDPYNLQVGSQIAICRDREQGHGGGHGMDGAMNPGMLELNNQMRLAWEQHVYWVRMQMISILSNLMDLAAVDNRVMENPGAISAVFAPYYPSDLVEVLNRLLTEHLQIGKDLITNWSQGQMDKANELNRRWYHNADLIGDTLNQMNPAFDRGMLTQMLYGHLDSVKQQAANRMAGRYDADIQAFDMGEQGILQLADYLTQGIAGQFPGNF